MLLKFPHDVITLPSSACSSCHAEACLLDQDHSFFSHNEVQTFGNKTSAMEAQNLFESATNQLAAVSNGSMRALGRRCVEKRPAEYYFVVLGAQGQKSQLVVPLAPLLVVLALPAKSNHEHGHH